MAQVPFSSRLPSPAERFSRSFAATEPHTCDKLFVGKRDPRHREHKAIPNGAGAIEFGVMQPPVNVVFGDAPLSQEARDGPSGSAT